MNNVVIHGMRPIIQRDLDKHKKILENTKLELLSFKGAVQQEVARKKHYLTLVGNGKYNDDSLRDSIKQSNINIRAMEDKARLAEEKIKHNDLIVTTLSDQLKTYDISMNELAKRKILGK